MIRGVSCCHSRAGEDMSHFLVVCGEFERDRQVLLDEDEECRILGASVWLDEFLKAGQFIIIFLFLFHDTIYIYIFHCC